MTSKAVEDLDEEMNERVMRSSKMEEGNCRIR